MSKTCARIPSLDGLRAVAISMVLLGHLTGTKFFFIQNPDGKISHLTGTIAQMGVRVFFVISGFLITTLLKDELTSTGKICLTRFYFRRTLRIFPAFYVYVFAVWAAAFAGYISLSPGTLLHAVSYTTNYCSGCSWFLIHSWSLSVEEQFYLIWPILLCLLGWRRAVIGAMVFIISLPVMRLGFRIFPSVYPCWQSVTPNWGDAIATGCVLAAIRDDLYVLRWCRSFYLSAWFLLVPFVVLVGTLLSGYPTGWTPVVTRIPTNIAIALIIDRSTRVSTDLVGTVLNSRPMRSIGLLSYSLYVWQQPFLNHYSNALVCTFPVNLLLSIAASVVSYFVVEKPCLGLRSTLERRWVSVRVIRAAGLRPFWRMKTS